MLIPATSENVKDLAGRVKPKDTRSSINRAKPGPRKASGTELGESSPALREKRTSKS